MKRTLGCVAVVAFSSLGAFGSVAFADSVGIDAGEIIIRSSGLTPEVFLVEPEQRVLFLNRSGRQIHIEFMMLNDGQHHFIQVQERIWAVFHRTGRHPYVVHFGGAGIPDLQGAVDVVDDPYGRPDPTVCSGITVMGGCLER